MAKYFMRSRAGKGFYLTLEDKQQLVYDDKGDYIQIEVKQLNDIGNPLAVLAVFKVLSFVKDDFRDKFEHEYPIIREPITFRLYYT